MPDNSDERVLRAKARQHGLGYVSPRLIDTSGNLAGLLPGSVARAFNVLPQPSRGAALKVLLSDPLDFEAIDAVRFSCGRQIEVALATYRAIEESIDLVYGKDPR
jgi:type IV pilus assembly protein PilB